MSTIRAVVRNGRIATEEPLGLPEGTELLIPIPDRRGDDEPGWDNSPGGIADWLEWADSLQPLILSEQDAAEAEEWRKRCARRTTQKRCQDAGRSRAGIGPCRDQTPGRNHRSWTWTS